MSELSVMPNEVDLCLQSVCQAAQGGRTPALAAALIDLLWSVSDARPDLDQLPVSISRSEHRMRESGDKGDIAALGSCVKHVLVDSAVKRLPKDVQERVGCAVAGMEHAAKRKDIIGLANATRGAVRAVAQQGQSSSDLPVVQNGNTICIGRHFSVSFCRTLRVPDDGKTYPLPAGLGHFPLHSVADFANRVPPRWLEVGGFFLPMYQSEAMFLSLGGVSWRPNIAKVGVGKINAVTGKPWDERIRAHEQDYLLCPEQRWLDGINAGNGFVRQFVAMPLGHGYTVEEQVTDEDRFGGIQIVACEAKKGIFPEEDPEEPNRRAREVEGNTILLEGIARLPEPFRSVLAMSVLGFSVNQIGAAVSLPQELIERYEAKVQKQCATSRTEYKSGDGKVELIADIQREGLRRLEAVAGKGPADRLRWRIFPSDIVFSMRDEQMGIAAGGTIHQKIVDDPYGAETWDETAHGSIWVHLANSGMYERITGKRPPGKPMDARQYQHSGVPWFSYYVEGSAAVGPSRILSRIKSIFALDQQRGPVHSVEVSIPVDPNKVVGIRIPSSKERITALLSATEAAAGAGRHRSASRLATAVLDLDSCNAHALCLRGEAQLRLGLYERARDDAGIVIESDSANWVARRIRAEAILMLGMPEVALAEASAALRLSGGDAGFQEIMTRAEATIGESQGKEPGN